MLFAKTITLVLTWDKGLNGNLSVTPVRTDSLVKLILGKRQNVIFLRRNICLFLVLELEGLSHSLLLKYGRNDDLSLLLITKRLEIIQIMAKNVRKRNELSFGLFLENFSFLKQLLGVLYQIFICLKQNLLQSQMHERGPSESKSIDVSSLLLPFERNGQHAQLLTVLVWPLPILLWLARPNWTLFLKWLMWCTQKRCIIVDF